MIPFRSPQQLSGVAVYATPSLSNVLSISPTGFPQLSANTDYHLTLKLSAPPTSQIRIDGTLQMKSTAKPGATVTFARPLPVTIVVHSERVPPDPGDAGKQTLAGIDSDYDGVRDDVQRYLVRTYIDRPRELEAATQHARARLGPYKTLIAQGPSALWIFASRH